MIGKILFHYKVSEKIRQGRMGEVHRAEYTSLKLEVAIQHCEDPRLPSSPYLDR